MIKHYEGINGSFDYDDEEWEVSVSHEDLKYIGKETDGRNIHIPEGVKCLRFTFIRTNLSYPPVIPDSVRVIYTPFLLTPNLECLPEIPDNLEYYGFDSVSTQKASFGYTEDENVDACYRLAPIYPYFLEDPSTQDSIQNRDELWGKVMFGHQASWALELHVLLLDTIGRKEWEKKKNAYARFLLEELWKEYFGNEEDFEALKNLLISIPEKEYISNYKEFQKAMNDLRYQRYLEDKRHTCCILDVKAYFDWIVNKFCPERNPHYEGKYVRMTDKMKEIAAFRYWLDRIKR